MPRTLWTEHHSQLQFLLEAADKGSRICAELSYKFKTRSTKLATEQLGTQKFTEYSSRIIKPNLVGLDFRLMTDADDGQTSQDIPK